MSQFHQALHAPAAEADAAPLGPTRASALLCLAIAVIGANALVLSPLLADIARDFSTDAVTVARATAAYGGATAASAFFLAPLIDRIGAGRALRAALLLLALSTLASAFAGSWWLLAGAQALAGLAAGVLLPAVYALASALGGERDGAKLLGRVLAGWSIAMCAGVPLGGLIADFAGWRATFLVLAGLASLAWLGTARLRFVTVNAGGAAVSRRAALARAGVKPLLLACFMLMTAFYGVYALLGDHLRAALGVSAGTASIAMLGYGIGFGLASLGDPLIDRLGAARVFAPVFLACAGINAALNLAGHGILVAALLCAAWGFANHFALNTLVLRLSAAAGAAKGTVLGLNSAVTYLGALAGSGGFALIYADAGFAPLPFMAAAALLIGAIAGLFGRRAG